MKLLVLIMGLLLVAQTTTAATLQQADRIVVVSAAAPATDVIVGANFAAAINAENGDVYTSALDTDAYAQITDFKGKVIVLISGKSVRILGTDADVANYFKNQGFNVESIASPSREDLLVSNMGKTAKSEDKPNTTKTSNTKNISKNTTQTPPEQILNKTLPNNKTITLPETADANPTVDVNLNFSENKTEDGESQRPVPQQNPERPGFFKRIARWFANLF